MRKKVFIIVVLILVVSLNGHSQCSPFIDTFYVTAPTGQTLTVLYDYTSVGYYTLTGSPSGHLIVPHEVTLCEWNGQEMYCWTVVPDWISFNGCNNLQSVALANGYTDVSNEAFKNCSNLQTVQLPNTIVSIGSSAFFGCTSLQNINIPSSVVTIGNAAFYNCTSLSSITIPSSVTTIGNQTFFNCNSLSSISLPSSVVSIGGQSFAKCNLLTSFVFPPLIRHIGIGLFYGCTSLSSVVLPDSLISIGNYDQNVFSGYPGDMPSDQGVDGYWHSSRYWKGAFSHCTSLDSIFLPNTVKEIGEYSFAGCTNLSIINFPDSVHRLGDYAFSGCGFTNMNIPNSIERLGYGTFRKCLSLQEVTIPENLTHIGYCTFDSCVNLTTVNFNAKNCTSGVGAAGLFSTIGVDFFEGRLWLHCPNFTNLNIGDSVRILKDDLFSSASSITEVTIPPSIDTIGFHTFENCSGLRKVYFNASTIHFYGTGFSSCNNIDTVIIGNNVTRIPSAFMNGKTLHYDIIIPESVRYIGQSAFSSCNTGQSTLVLPHSVDTILSDAFHSFNCDTLVLYCDSLDTIGYRYFEGMFPQIVFVHFSTPPNYWIPRDYSHGADLYVPCGAGEVFRAYNNNTYYTYRFQNIIDSMMEISLNADAHGSAEVLVSPTCESDTAVFQAIPDTLYRFTHWSDGDTSNPRTLVLTQDTSFTAYFEKMCDSFIVTAPYTADFNDCWTTTGNAYIDSLGRGIVPGVGDTLFSPWISIDSNMFVSLQWVRLISTQPLSPISVNIISPNGQTLCHYSISNGTGNRINVGYLSGEIGRLVITHPEGNNPMSIAVTNVLLFDYYIRCTVVSPDTVYVGDTVTYSMNVQRQGNGTLTYSWTAYGDATVLSGANQRTLSVVWNSPGSNISLYYYVYSNYYSYLNNSYQYPYVSGTKNITVIPRPVAVDCDSIALPYTAEFTQCWTSSGGANIVDNNQAVISGPGQSLTGPWMNLPDESVFMGVSLTDSSMSAHCRISLESDSGIVEYSSYWSSYSPTTNWFIPFDYRNGRSRLVIEYDDTTSTPITVSNIVVYSYPIAVTAEFPSSAHVGDTSELKIHIELPEGVSPDYVGWSYYRNWSWLSDADTCMTIIASTDSSKTVVWNVEGTYQISAEASKYRVFGNHSANASTGYIPITVLPQQASTDCDYIALPYTADFTQCWTALNGATIIDAGHASINGLGNKVIGPWLSSEYNKVYISYHYIRSYGDYWSSTDSATRIRMIIELEDGTVVSDSRETFYQSNDGLNTYIYIPSSRRFRVIIENDGGATLPLLHLSDVFIFSYPIETSIEAPVTAAIGDTVVVNGHVTHLSDDVVRVSWYMDGPDGGWYYIGDDNNIFSVVSQCDTGLSLVWHSPGRYRINLNANHPVAINYTAYSFAYHTIIITDSSCYIEDSIYYASAAKDTVIGCHPQLHSANLPECVRVITDSAFFNLDNLSSIFLPDGLIHIGKMAFARNQGITELTLPRELQYVGDNAFGWDTNLAVVNYNADSCTTMCEGFHDNGSYYPVFISCHNLSTVNIGENVRYIPNYAFSSCNLSGLLTIPDSVTYIGHLAFYQWNESNTSPWDIVIGANVLEIGAGAFGCPAGHIASVTSRNPVPPIAVDEQRLNYAFWVEGQGVLLTVPCNTLEAYSNNAGWSRFDPIIEDCTGIEDTPNDNISITAIDGSIIVCGAEHETVSVYDMMGRLVATTAPTRGDVSVVVPLTGVYMVRVGNLPVRKVVVIK